MKNVKLRGTMTIEMSIIIPLTLFMIMGLILTVFYFHDKNILNGAASETVAVGSRILREEEQIAEEELQDFCRERIRGKCFYLVSHQIDIDIKKEEIVVEISAGKGKMAVSAVRRAAVTDPEKKIRDIRRLSRKNGEKNHD